MPCDCRVYLVSLWSDSFQVNVLLQRKEKDIEVITLTFETQSKEDFNNKLMTHNLAIGSKRDEHQTILADVLEKIKCLENWAIRYSGIEKKLIPTAIYCTKIQQDTPERRNSSQLAGVSGTYHKRFGYSCFYHDKIHSCQSYFINRLHEVVKCNIFKGINEKYTNCSDWWGISDSMHGLFDKPKYYPKQFDSNGPQPPPERPINNQDEKLQPCKLSFRFLLEAFNVTVHNLSEHVWTKETSKDYLRTCCVHGQLIEVTLNVILENRDSNNQYIIKPPEIWSRHREHGIDVSNFVETLMHQTQLGITKHLLKRYDLCLHKEEFQNYSGKITANLKNIEKLSLLWCRTLPFSNIEKPPLGTCSWQASHCTGFGRMSVFYLSQLDDFIENKSEKVISKVKSLQRVGVLWYCVLSRIYGNDGFNPTGTGAFIKLFLNAYIDLSSLASKDGAFFKDTSNYFGLLNLSTLFAEFGDPSKLWEGDREAWIKFVKKYLVSLCA